jgi:site-specific DNA recombinase
MYYSNTVIQPNINTNLSEMEKIERKRLMGISELPDPNTPYTIRCVFYTRVSTGPQSEDGKASLPEQKRAALEVIEHNKWLLMDEYQDVAHTSYEESPSERKGLSKALVDAKEGRFDVLIVWIDSRLGRNPDETRSIRKMFREFGVQIYSIKKPLPVIDPRFFTSKIDKFRMIQEGFNDLTSASESAEFAEKMQFGKMKVAMDGKMPSRIPYGYRKKLHVINQNGRDKAVSEVISDELQLAVAKEIFDLYLNQGFGIRKICGSLNSKKTSGPKGGKWNYSTVRYVLKNPAYAGKVRWGWKLSEFRRSKQRLARGHNGIIVNGQHKSVISEEDFIKVQKKMEQRAQLGGRAVASHGLLVGLLKCPICGFGAYAASFSTSYAYKMERMGKPKDRFSKVFCYVCSTVSKYGNSACKRYIGSQEKIERLLVNEVRNLAQSKETQVAFEKTLKNLNDKDLTKKNKMIERELAKIPQIKDRYSKAFERKLMSFDEYGRQLNRVAESEKDLNAQFAELQVLIKENEKIKERVSKAISVFKNFDKIWGSATLEVKKDLLRSIIKKIVYSKNKLKIEYQI